MPKNKLSILALLFIFAVYAFAFSRFQMWETGTRGGDPLGYYTYLPATFLYQDLERLEKTNEARGKYLPRKFSENFYEEQFITNRTENGNQVIKYTCGIAITCSFFWNRSFPCALFRVSNRWIFSDLYIFPIFGWLFLCLVGALVSSINFIKMV